MGVVPGRIITLLTFPGVIVHELAHQFFCRVCRVAVLDVCYFQLDKTSGYVIHEKPKSPYSQILIGIGPFFVNTILGAMIALPAVIPLMKFGTDFNSNVLLSYFLIWLGFSIAMHSFPSIGDAGSLLAAITDKGTNIFVKLIGFPIVILIFLGALGSIIWLDAIYGFGVINFMPNLIAKILA